mgnify:CR=1 FL=1
MTTTIYNTADPIRDDHNLHSTKRCQQHRKHNK